MRREAWCVTVVVLCALVALPGGVAPARVPDASAAAACAKETKRLETFRRGMKAAKRRYFRAHGSAKARKRFVKQQKRKLAALRRARKRCLAKPPAATAPPAPAPAAPGVTPPAQPATTPTPTATPASTPAEDAIADVVSEKARFAPEEVTTENGVEYVRTQLELELHPDATVAEMDALLARLDAEVVSSLEGVGLLTVRIPDPGSLAALRALAAGLAGAPGLAHADLATVPVTTELPDIQPADAGLLRPQLAAGAHAMWNARGGLDGAAPTLLMADYFGAGPPGPEVAVAEVAGDFATGNVHPHGYTVLGMAAGTFESGAVADLSADRVAGMWAGPDLPLRVIDLRTSIAGSTLHDRILQRVGAIAGDVVVNTSVADGCAPAGCTVEEIHRDALQWIRRVRDSGLEDRFLHVSAAGNIYPNLPNDISAWRGAAVNAAALIPLPGGVQNLTNTIVVENTTASDPADGPIAPICLTADSKRGGHVSAVGNDIRSFGAPGVFRNLPAGGTSNAAPQVSGTAATVWALAPGLSPAGLAGILRATAQPVVDTGGDPRCGDAPAAPALDAYAATLAADGAAVQRAREAILDADDDGDVDEDDIAAFRDGFVASAGDGTVDLDYGRFDLNGDGYTGGGRDRYDLDASSPPAWSFSRRREVLGLEVLHDERSVRDLDVLCHEMHGPLYTGDEAARDTFAQQHCLPPVDITVSPAFPTSMSPGQSAPLRVVARRSDLTDASVSQQPGVHLTFQAASGTVTPASGLTGQDGAFTATAALGATGGFEATVIARAGETGPELDRLTVTATRTASATVVRTFSRGSATAFAVANGSGQGDPDVSPPGVTSFDGSGAITRTEDGESASGSGTISFAEQYAGDQLRGVDVEISGSASAAGERAQGEGGGGYTLRFTVGAGGMPYSVAGSVAASGADELSCQGSRGHAYLFRLTQPSGLLHETCAPRDPSALDWSGSLAAGSYEFYVDAIGNTGGAGVASSAADVTLTLGP